MAEKEGAEAEGGEEAYGDRESVGGPEAQKVNEEAAETFGGEENVGDCDGGHEHRREHRDPHRTVVSGEIDTERPEREDA